MAFDKKYIDAYMNYLKFNTLHSFEVSDEIRKLLKGSKNVLDYAAGDGLRTLEFIRWFLSDGVKVEGYDINQDWASLWDNTLKDYNTSWLSEFPKGFAGDLIYCSHGVYMPDIKKEVFELFLNSDVKVLAIRAFNKSSIFRSFTKSWGIEGNYDWEDKLNETIVSNNLKFKKIVIPCSVEFSKQMIKDYAYWVKVFVKFSGDVKKIEDIISEYADGDMVKIDNSDIIYFIYK